MNKRRGGNLPLMNLHERVLSVLGCKYMNDVLIDAPAEITPDMIASLRITEVVHGSESDDSSDINFGKLKISIEWFTLFLFIATFILTLHHCFFLR